MTQLNANRPLLGVSLVMLAMLILGYIDNFIALIAEDVGLWQFHFLRSILMCGALAVLAKAFKWRIRPHNWRAVAARSFLMASVFVLYFGAAGMMPLSQVGAGLFSSPIFVLLFSVLFYGTRIGIWRIFAVVLGSVGVILILRPSASDVSVLSLIPVLAGALYAQANISTRQWCGGEPTAALVMGAFLMLGLFGAIGLLGFTLFPAPPDLAEALPFFTRGWVAPSGRFTFWLLVQAVGSLGAVALLTRGYQLAEVSFVTVFEYSFLVFAAFWGWMLWGIALDLRGVLGIAAIILSGVIIALRSR
ncbi:MAG: DMT family transporter [Alphaproteobacteria bacterium]|nr:DMT family transporter [Alphaproteobacteria bacterium]